MTMRRFRMTEGWFRMTVGECDPGPLDRSADRRPALGYPDAEPDKLWEGFCNASDNSSRHMLQQIRRNGHLLPDQFIYSPVIHCVFQGVASGCLSHIHLTFEINQKQIAFLLLAFQTTVMCPETHFFQFYYANIRNTHGLFPITSPSFFHWATFLVFM